MARSGEAAKWVRRRLGGVRGPRVRHVRERDRRELGVVVDMSHPRLRWDGFENPRNRTRMATDGVCWLNGELWVWRGRLRVARLMTRGVTRISYVSPKAAAIAAGNIPMIEVQHHDAGGNHAKRLTAPECRPAARAHRIYRRELITLK